MFFLFKRKKHKKHNNKNPLKSDKKKRCGLSKLEYDIFVSKLMDKDNSAVIINIE